MQALGRQRLHLAPELLSKCSKAMHLARSTTYYLLFSATATCISCTHLLAVYLCSITLLLSLIQSSCLMIYRYASRDGSCEWTCTRAADTTHHSPRCCLYAQQELHEHAPLAKQLS